MLSPYKDIFSPTTTYHMDKLSYGQIVTQITPFIVTLELLIHVTYQFFIFLFILSKYWPMSCQFR